MTFSNTYVNDDLWNTAGQKESRLRIPGVNDIQARINGSQAISLSVTGDESIRNNVNYNVMNSRDTGSRPPVLRVGYAPTGTNPTIVMNGTGTFHGDGNGFYNLTTSGTVTLADTFYMYGTLDLTGGTVTPGASNIVMSGVTGTIKGASQTLGTVTIASSNTTTFSSSDVTINNLLFSPGGSISIDSLKTVTSLGTLSGVTANILGAGTFRYMNSAPPNTAGTLSATFRYDSTNGNQTIANRTYDGPVEVVNTGAGAATDAVTSVGTLLLNSSLTLSNTGSGSLAVTIDTYDRPTTINGAFTIGAGTTWSSCSTSCLTLNGNYTNNGTFVHDAGTVTLAGSSPQTLSGTLSGSSGKFNNLIVTNASGSDPDATPSVIFSAGLETAGLFTAATNDVKLRFLSGATNTLNGISFTGASGHNVSLRSSTPGTATVFNVGAGTRSVSYTSVKDNTACGSTGGTIDASTAGTNVDLGNTACWLINSVTFTWTGGNALHLGTLSTTTTQWASTTTPATSETASGMSFTFGTNATSGAVVTMYANSLSGPQTITPISGGPTAVATPGTAEQVGMRFAKASGSGTTTSVSPFNGALGSYGFTAGTTSPVVNTGGGQSLSADTYNVYMMANVLPTTKPGSYSTTLTFVATGTF